MSALGPGAVQINVQAAFQGQIASAAISQTNFATAAAAAQASTAAGASGGTGGSTGAAGGAAGGGGGISGTTIGIIGAAVAGGAVAATQLADKGDEEENTAPMTFSTPLAFQYAFTTTVASQGGTNTCVSTRSVSATLTITLTNSGTTGEVATRGTMRDIAAAGGPTCVAQSGQVPFDANFNLTGGPSALTGTRDTTATSTSPATVTVRNVMKFEGALSGNSITGTFGFSETSTGTNAFNGVIGSVQGSGQATTSVTLTKS
jgi:hypothetical protein